MTKSERPKLIYVAQRHPRYTHEAFIQRWRQHAAVGMSQPRWRNVARYLHCDRIDALPEAVPPLDCDGVAVVVYRSESARQAHIADESARRTMKQDELDTFAQPVANTSLLVSEDLARSGPVDGFRLFVFWPAGSPDGALAVCDNVLDVPEVGWTRNHPAGRIGSWECARVDELIAATIEPLCALATRFGNALHAARAQDDELSRHPPRLVLTHTVVLHDVP